MIALLAAVAALAGQTPAAAPLAAGPEVFADFQAMCVAHRGDLNAPIADAEAKGWIPIPESMLAGKMPKGVTNGQVRVKLGEGGAEYVFTGSGDIPAPGIGTIHAGICFLGAQPGDFAGGAAKAKSFAKVEPLMDTDKGVAYAFTDGPAGRKAISLKDQSEAAAALKAPGLTVLIVQSTQGGTGVQFGYAVPTL